MARRRRPAPAREPETAPELRTLPLSAWVDPRDLLTLDGDPVLGSALGRAASTEGHLRTLRAHRPQLVKSEPVVRAEAEHWDGCGGFRDARREARRRRLPMPGPADYFDGFNPIV